LVRAAKNCAAAFTVIHKNGFVIGDVNEDKLIDAISKLEKQIGREINYTLMTNEEFLKKKQEKNSFLVNIFNKKIIKLI